jgi:hypothetical protein
MLRECPARLLPPLGDELLEEAPALAESEDTHSNGDTSTTDGEQVSTESPGVCSNCSQHIDSPPYEVFRRNPRTVLSPGKLTASAVHKRPEGPIALPETERHHRDGNRRASHKYEVRPECGRNSQNRVEHFPPFLRHQRRKHAHGQTDPQRVDQKLDRVRRAHTMPLNKFHPATNDRHTIVPVQNHTP